MQAHPFILLPNVQEVCSMRWAIHIPDYEYISRQCPPMTVCGIILQRPLQLHTRTILLQQLTIHDCMRKFMETSQHFM
jgi:hypothetical protein